MRHRAERADPGSDEFELRLRKRFLEISHGVVAPAAARGDRAAEKGDATLFLHREFPSCVGESVPQLVVVAPLWQLGGVVAGRRLLLAKSSGEDQAKRQARGKDQGAVHRDEARGHQGTHEE